MVDTKKEQERDELHRAIWAIADELRGAVDGWDFKNYVLGTMFYRYISENLTAYINEGEIEAGNIDFDYARLTDKEAEEARAGLVQEKGFFILPSELFCNVRAKAMVDENLNENLEGVFRNIEESAKGSQSENSFAGLFDDFDVNSNKLGSTVAKRNERLAKLLDGVAAMNLGSVKNHDIDAFGDAYESKSIEIKTFGWLVCAKLLIRYCLETLRAIQHPDIKRTLHTPKIKMHTPSKVCKYQ